MSPLRLPGAQGGSCSGEGKQQCRWGLLSTQSGKWTWRGGIKNLLSKLFQWEGRSQTSCCRQLSWVKNASSGFREAKVPVHYLLISAFAMALLWADLSSRLEMMLFLTRMCAPAWLEGNEMALEPQPSREACSCKDCSLPLGPCNFQEIIYAIMSWTPHYGQISESVSALCFMHLLAFIVFRKLLTSPNTEIA